MGNKKKSDFSKVKVKIGKSKPSNNVTKFTIKTAKVVLRGDAQDKVVAKKDDESYLSSEKNDLMENLKRTDELLTEYISKKNVIAQEQRLDLTQSLWMTYFNNGWVTPWDDLVSEYCDKMGPLQIWLYVVFDSAADCLDKSVNEHMVRTINLYLQFLGDTERGSWASKPILEIAKKYLNSLQRGKKLLGIEIISILAQHCPTSLWYHARRKASIFVLQLLSDMFEGTKKHYEQILNEDKFIMLAQSILYSALDGRKAGSIIIGEDWSQIDDIENPPFNDLIYKGDEEKINIEIDVVTDSKDKWDETISVKQKEFNLEDYLTSICCNILEISLKIFPLTLGCQESLEKILKAVLSLNRCCLRARNTPQWSTFVKSLLDNFPYNYKESNELVMEFDENEHDLIKKKLSKSEKKLRLKRLELASKMRELCQESKIVKDVKAVIILNEELNYYSVALVHQCVISDKVNAEEVFLKWLPLVETLLNSLKCSRNEVLYKWLILANQMFHLTFDKSSHASMPLCVILADFCRNTFVGSHPHSKVKRLSLAVYVDYCQGILLMSSRGDHNNVALPQIDAVFLNLLIMMMLEDQRNSGTIGYESRHPTYVSSQKHIDITLPKALYRLLLINYPGVADFVNDLDVEKTFALKIIMNTLRREMKAAEYPTAKRSWNRCRLEHLNYIPSKYLWDYFTFENVSRKDGTVERMKPLCSSVAFFLLK